MKMSYDDIKKAVPRPEAINFKVTKEEREDIHKFCKDRNFRVSAFCRVVIAEAIKSYDEGIKDGKEE